MTVLGVAWDHLIDPKRTPHHFLLILSEILSGHKRFEQDSLVVGRTMLELWALVLVSESYNPICLSLSPASFSIEP